MHLFRRDCAKRGAYSSHEELLEPNLASLGPKASRCSVLGAAREAHTPRPWPVEALDLRNEPGSPSAAQQ